MNRGILRRKSRSETDWPRVDAMKDQDMDLTDSPEMGTDFFRRAKVVLPAPKERITIRLDREIVDYFRGRSEEEGGGYQSWINAVLKRYVGSCLESERERLKGKSRRRSKAKLKERRI
ncbi:MAG: BrnA antitoxin family protein [Thermodesulfobacteriota bacterium]